jgi:hypothetical protein
MCRHYAPGIADHPAVMTTIWDCGIELLSSGLSPQLRPILNLSHVADHMIHHIARIDVSFGRYEEVSLASLASRVE